MNLSHDGLCLWYDTPDAPAPPQHVPDSGDAVLTIAVQPLNAANSVKVRYRVDGGPLRTVTAHAIRADYARRIHYFRARFPRSMAGSKVDYCPVANCAGRQVPKHGTENQMLSCFWIRPDDAPTGRQGSADDDCTVRARFVPALTFLGQITVELKPPTIIGKTPAGFRIDFYAKKGSVRGNAFSATVMEDSVDYMVVRPDGIGLIEIHATLKTDDGAWLTASYSGTVDFGEDGFQRVAAGDYPELPRFQVSPRLLTAAPNYEWMNRTHFLGVGRVDLKKLMIWYDLFAVRTLLAAEEGLDR